MVRITDTEGAQCDYHFAYVVNSESQSYLRILNGDCTKLNVATITWMIVLVTFLIGLMFIGLVKVHNVVQDKREFAKFEKERLNQTQYEFQSPLYRSPVSQYEMPQNTFQNDSAF